MSALESFRDAIILFFSGIGILLSLVITVYAFTCMLDRISCLNSSADVLTPQELEERRIASSLTRRAGVAGILIDERLRIFRIFFEKRAMPYEKTKDTKNEDDDIESQKKYAPETLNRKWGDGHEDIDSSDKGSTQRDGNGAQDTDTQDESSDSEEDANAVCPICLNEYGTFDFETHKYR
jgi:hypothetical protein